MNVRRWAPQALVLLALAAMYAALTAHQIALPAADDLPRHIKNGELLLHGEWRVLYENLYSYTEPNYLFVNHHWLSGVVFYAVYALAGYVGLGIFKTLVLIGAFTILFLTACKRTNFWLVAAASIPALVLLAPRHDVRPEIFSFLFIAIWLYMLFDAEDRPESNRLWILAPLQVLWANMHIYAPIGLFMVGGFLFERIVRYPKRFWKDAFVQKLALLTLALALACTLNPHGLRGAVYPYVSLSGFEGTIPVSENLSVPEYLRTQPPSLYIPLYYWMLAAMLPVLIVLARKRSVFLALAGLSTSILAYKLSRGMALFAFMFVPIAAIGLDKPFQAIQLWISRVYPHAIRIIGIFLALMFFGITGWIAVLGLRGLVSDPTPPGFGLAPYAADSIAFFQHQRLAGPIFNNTDIGSYLIYYLYPREKVFIDNRFADAYSREFLQGWLSIVTDENEWRRMLAKQDFNVIYLYQYSGSALQFLDRRMNDPEWVWIYGDPYVVILVRNRPENAEVIEKYAITPENAEERFRYLRESGNIEDLITMGDLLNMAGRRDLGIATFKEAVMRDPKRGKTWVIMGMLELAKSQEERNPSLALQYLNTGIEAGHRTAEAYSFKGLAHAMLEQYDECEKALKKALSINPERGDARKLLDDLHTFLAQQASAGQE